MGRITKLFAQKIISNVDADFDKKALLASLGLDHNGSVDPSQMLGDNQYYDLLEQMAALDRDPKTLPLRTGASMRCDEYGALGLAMKSALTLRGTYERAIRYAIVLTSVAGYELERTPEGAYMHLRRSGERRLGMRLSNEATIASIATIAREVSTQPLRLLGVFFQHPSPGGEEHRNFFGCPAYFDAPRDALWLSNDMLDTPNQVGDEGISRFFDAHLREEIQKWQAPPTLEQEVKSYVSRVLSEGVPTISETAQKLAMSGRTLQRRLSENGTSYQHLVDEARRQLAETLISDTDYSLADIAFMSGFSEQSAFSRAFKRWKGQSPRSYRLQSQTSTPT